MLTFRAPDRPAAEIVRFPIARIVTAGFSRPRNPELAELDRALRSVEHAIHALGLQRRSLLMRYRHVMTSDRDGSAGEGRAEP